VPADQTPISREACRAYLDESTFRLRPKDYTEKYPIWPGAVGLEIEMLPVMPAAPGEAPGRMRLQGEGLTSAALLATEARRRGWGLEYTDGDHGHQLLLRVDLNDGGGNFSFEPGGQVEFSSKPYPCLSDAVKHLRDMQGVLDQVFGAHGIKIFQVGINPWHTVPEIGLQMPKGRYRAMDAYFSRIGPFGQRMMRQTCTIQVNLDFGPDESTMARRYLAGQLIAPFAAATFANSPVVDRASTGVPGFRSRVWRRTDATRTGLPGLERLGETPDRKACIETYLDFVLSAHVVFVTGLDYKVPERPIAFGDWLKAPIEGVRPTMADFATHLSLMFPEVRPRGFLELRSIDCQPRAFEAAPAAYTTGLLYDPRTLDRVLALLLPRRLEMHDLLARAEEGLRHPTLRTVALQVMDLAAEGFQALPSCFKTAGAGLELTAFREHFTARGRTPADDVLDQMQAAGQPWMPAADLEALEGRWAKLVSNS
jgi:glutamate--cysteine ligase